MIEFTTMLDLKIHVNPNQVQYVAASRIAHEEASVISIAPDIEIKVKGTSDVVAGKIGAALWLRNDGPDDGLTNCQKCGAERRQAAKTLLRQKVDERC